MRRGSDLDVGCVLFAVRKSIESGNLTAIRMTWNALGRYETTHVTLMQRLQLSHFNGASPITRFSSLLTKTLIDYIHWDNYSHM